MERRAVWRAAIIERDAGCSGEGTAIRMLRYIVVLMAQLYRK